MTSNPASEALRYCAWQGSVVGLQEWLPVEPFDYDWGRNNPQIGCDHIRCAKCGERVISTPLGESARSYKCRCAKHVAHRQTPLGGDSTEYRGLSAYENPPPSSWACAGHPALTVPSTVDGVRISPDRFLAIARLGFESPPFVPPDTTGHSIWVSRLFWILPESLRPALVDAVYELVLDQSPVVAVRAMRFFYEQRNAVSNERLTAIARDHGARFAKIADPDHPELTLENELLAALEPRGFRRDDSGQLIDPEAHELLRQAVRAGKNPNNVIYTFGRVEPEWLAAHAAEIVKSSRSLLRPVVWLLKTQPPRLRDDAYRAVAALDPATRAELEKRIEAELKGDERAQVLAALGPHAATTSSKPATVVVTTGPRATRTVEMLDSVEAELIGFVREKARRLDPRFPPLGIRGPNERGQWTGDDGVVTLMQQVEEFDTEGHGIRTLRLMRVTPPNGPHDSVLQVIAVGLANGARLELRWNFVTTDAGLRGTSAELTVDGAGKEQCIADFRAWFDAT